jgi:hypothetical protein
MSSFGGGKFNYLGSNAFQTQGNISSMQQPNINQQGNANFIEPYTNFTRTGGNNNTNKYVPQNPIGSSSEIMVQNNFNVDSITTKYGQNKFSNKSPMTTSPNLGGNNLLCITYNL